jgi:hypothetical protein
MNFEIKSMFGSQGLKLAWLILASNRS